MACAPAMMALAYGQFPFRAAVFASAGALLRAACEHCCFLAASSQREKLAAAADALPVLAAAMQASQAFAPLTGAGGVGLVPAPVFTVAVLTGSIGGSVALGAALVLATGDGVGEVA